MALVKTIRTAKTEERKNYKEVIEEELKDYIQISTLNKYNCNGLEILFNQDERYLDCFLYYIRNTKFLEYNGVNSTVGTFLYRVQENLDKRRDYKEVEKSIKKYYISKKLTELHILLEDLTLESVNAETFKLFLQVVKENKTKDFLEYWRKSGFWRTDACLCFYTENHMNKNK